MQTVLGVFDDRATAERAITRLTESGFNRSDIHLEPAGSSSLDSGGTATASTTSSYSSGSSDSVSGRSGDHDKGVMASIGDFFSNLFGTDDSAPHRDHYAEAVRRGSVVLVVDARDEDEAERAADVLDELGAVNIDERAEQWRSTGWTGASYNDSATPPSGQQMMVGGASAHPQVARLQDSDTDRSDPLLDRDRPALGADPYTDSSDRLRLRDTDADSGVGGRADLQGERKLEVVQEELQIGKRTLDRGGVRVVQRMSEKPVREIVRLREEHAVVERRNVDRDATAGDLSMGKDVVVEVREKVEEPVVAKRAHVVEEVVVGKEVRERDQTINETVRRKDVDVERLEGEGSGVGRRNLEHAGARDADTLKPGTSSSGLIGGTSSSGLGSRRSDDDLSTGRETKDLGERRKP